MLCSCITEGDCFNDGIKERIWGLEVDKGKDERGYWRENQKSWIR